MKLIFESDAIKQLKKIPERERRKVIKKLHALENDPFSGKQLERDLRDHYSLRAWPYRIIYQIFKDKKIVLIESIKHRQGVYK